MVFLSLLPLTSVDIWPHQDQPRALPLKCYPACVYILLQSGKVYIIFARFSDPSAPATDKFATSQQSVHPTPIQAPFSGNLDTHTPNQPDAAPIQMRLPGVKAVNHQIKASSSKATQVHQQPKTKTPDRIL